MTRNTQRWYDKPVSKLIIVSIALTWMFPIFGFLLSSFRPGESIKRTSWWDAVYTGTIWSELSFNNYQEVFRAENLDRSFYNSLAVTIPSTIIPITIAAFAAYAFSFMEFKGKNVLFLFVVGSMIIPLQMSLIPLVQLFKDGIEIGGIPIIPALDLNGTITGEHGVGLHKKEYLLEEHGDNIPVMKMIKRSIDQNNIMNPGKIFDLN